MTLGKVQSTLVTFFGESRLSSMTHLCVQNRYLACASPTVFLSSIIYPPYSLNRLGCVCLSVGFFIYVASSTKHCLLVLPLIFTPFFVLIFPSIPSHSKSKFQASISYTAAYYFNVLPPFVRELKSYSSFKSHNRLFTLQHYS